MGWFSNLFKSKPGGTFLGNLCRGIGDAYTGGAYSSIFPPPPCGRFSYSRIVAASGWMTACRISEQRSQTRETDLNSFGLDDLDFGGLLTTVGDILIDGDVVEQTVVDAISEVLGDTLPPDIADTLGLNPDGTINDIEQFQQMSNSNPWTVDISVGGGGPQTPTTTTNNNEVNSTTDKLIAWVKDNVYIVIGLGTLLVASIGFYFYTKKPKKTKFRY